MLAVLLTESFVERDVVEAPEGALVDGGWGGGGGSQRRGRGRGGRGHYEQLLPAHEQRPTRMQSLPVERVVVERLQRERERERERESMTNCSQIGKCTVIVHLPAEAH